MAAMQAKAEQLQKLLRVNLKYQHFLREQIENVDVLMGENSEKKVVLFCGLFLEFSLTRHVIRLALYVLGSAFSDN